MHGIILFVRYILTLSDYFSKWVEAVPTPSKEAHQVANALYKVIYDVVLLDIN